MAKKEKTFNYKLYALVAFLLVAALLACTTFLPLSKNTLRLTRKSLP